MKEYSIGGSDIAAICGVSRFETPLMVWARLTGRKKPKEQDDRMLVGVELEDYIARIFAQKRKLKVRKKKTVIAETIQMGEYVLHLRGSVDRITNDGGILECKNTTSFNLKYFTNNSMPTEYLYQLNWYLGLLKRKKGYLAALIEHNHFIDRDVLPDEELFNANKQKVLEFFEKNLINDVAPLPTEKDYEILDEILEVREDEVILDNETERLAEKVKTMETEKNSLEKSIREYKAILKQKLNGAKIGKGCKYTLKLIEYSKPIIDKDALQRDGLYEKYLKTSNYTVLRINKGDEDDSEQPE